MSSTKTDINNPFVLPASSHSWPEDEASPDTKGSQGDLNSILNPVSLNQVCEEMGSETDKIPIPSDSLTATITTTSAPPASSSSPGSTKRVRFAIYDANDGKQDHDSEDEAADPDLRNSCRERSSSRRCESSGSLHRRDGPPPPSLSYALKQMLQVVLDQEPDQVRVTHHSMYRVMHRYSQARAEIARLQQQVHDLEDELRARGRDQYPYPVRPSVQQAEEQQLVRASHLPDNSTPTTSNRRVTLQDLRSTSNQSQLRESRRKQEARIRELLLLSRRELHSPTDKTDNSMELRPSVPPTTYDSFLSRTSAATLTSYPTIIDLDASVCSSSDTPSSRGTGINEDAAAAAATQATVKTDISDRNTYARRHTTYHPMHHHRTSITAQLSRLLCQSSRHKDNYEWSDTTTTASTSNDSESRSSGACQDNQLINPEIPQPPTSLQKSDDVWGVRVLL